jgi:hypothetical protein
MDPETLVAMAALLTPMATAAYFVPAQRAIRVDPLSSSQGSNGGLLLCRILFHRSWIVSPMEL